MDTKEHCHVEPIEKTASQEELQQQNQVLLSVLGMGCPNCAARVRNSILNLHGVISADVDHVRGLAKVSYNPQLTDVGALTGAVARAGNDGRHEYRALALS